MTKVILTATLLASILSLSACGVEIVDAGSTGVKKTLGKVSEEPLPPGFYMINPFTTSITEMDNRVQRYDDNTMAYTSDVQKSQVSFTVNYSLNQLDTVKIYKQVGRDYPNKLIPQVAEEFIKATM